MGRPPVRNGRETADRAGPSRAANALQLTGTGILAVNAVIGLAGAHLALLDAASVLLLVACLLLYISSIVDEKCGMVSMLTAFFFLFFVAIPAMSQVRSGTFPFGAMYGGSDLLRGFGVVSSGYGAIQVGAMVERAGRSPANTRPIRELVLDHAIMSRERRSLIGLARSTLFISTAVVAYAGVDALLRPRFYAARVDVDASDTLGQAIHVGRSASLVGLLCLLTLVVTANPGNRFRGVVGVAAPLAVAFVLLNWPASLPRFQLFGAMIAVCAVVLGWPSGRAKLVLGVTAPSLLLGVFPLSKALGNADGAMIAATQTTSFRDYLATGDFDAYMQVVNAWKFYDGYGAVGPGSIVSVLFFWVPRRIWPAKPVGSGQTVTEWLGFTFTNVSSPLPAEGLLLGGVLGVIALGVVFGVLTAVVERRVRLVGSTCPMHDAVLYALCSGFSIIILRGSLAAVSPMFMVAFVLVLISRHRHRHIASGCSSVVTGSRERAAWSRRGRKSVSARGEVELRNA